jgi:chromosome partitioning protein
MSLRASEAEKPKKDRLRFVLIDCPPSLNILTLNAMAAADSVLVPVQCEFFALEGITQLKETIEFVRASLNPKLEIHGVVLTMHDSRTRLADEVSQEVRTFFGQKVFDTVIPRNVRVAEAPSHGKPILLYDSKSPGSKAYVDLATEILHRERSYVAA